MINNDSVIIGHSTGSICIYGDNDPYIPQDIFHKFAESIDAKEVIIKNGGHLNTDLGYAEFAELLKYV